MTDTRDDNDKLKDGDLPEDPTADAEEMGEPQGDDKGKVVNIRDGKPVRPALHVAESLSARVAHLTSTHRDIRAHYENRGTPKGQPGKPADKSREAFDRTIVFDLIEKKITNRDELATAIYLRPDGAVQVGGKDIDYVADLVDGILETCGVADDDEEEDIDFAVEYTRMTDSDPKIFEFYIEGKKLTLEADQVVKKDKFEIAFLNALGRIPKLPVKGAEKSWRDYVNEWTENAIIVVLPPEASSEFSLRLDIIQAVDQLADGDVAGDLDMGSKLQDEACWLFKTDTVLKKVNENRSSSDKIGKHKLCDILRELGCEDKPRVVPVELEDDPRGTDEPEQRRQLPTKKVRTWRTPPTWPAELVAAMNREEPEYVDPRQQILPHLEAYL